MMEAIDPTFEGVEETKTELPPIPSILSADLVNQMKKIPREMQTIAKDLGIEETKVNVIFDKEIGIRVQKPKSKKVQVFKPEFIDPITFKPGYHMDEKPVSIPESMFRKPRK
jgi:hypothetical protein